jgi:hypothetical protein
VLAAGLSIQNVDISQLNQTKRGGREGNWKGARGRTYVLVLKELCDAKEELGRLLDGKRLAAVEEVDDPGEKRATLAGRDGRLVEHARLLNDGRLVVH